MLEPPRFSYVRMGNSYYITDNGVAVFEFIGHGLKRLSPGWCKNYVDEIVSTLNHSLRDEPIA